MATWIKAPPATALCLVCQGVFSLGRNRHGKVKQYCSRNCYLRERMAKIMDSKRPRQWVVKCRICDVDIKVKRNQWKKCYCSPKCREIATCRDAYAKRGKVYGAAQRFEKTCPRCGVAFVASFWKTTYCSKKCRRESQTRQVQRRAERNRPRMCPSCQNVFTQKNGQEKYCSRVCTGRESAFRRRCRVSQTVLRDWPSARKLMLRDGPKCRLCGVVCLWPFDVREPRSATADHIIPVAAGGDSVPENAQLLCLSCNARKQHKVAAGETGHAVRTNPC
jgi:hypothetical protein